MKNGAWNVGIDIQNFYSCPIWQSVLMRCMLPCVNM